MRRKILLGLCHFAFHRPWHMTALALAITAFLTFHAVRLRVDFDWYGFLPAESEAVQSAQLIREHYPTFDTIIVALQATETGQHRLLIDAADKMAEAFFTRDPRYVADIDYKIDRETLDCFGGLEDSRLMALMDDAEWQGLIERLDERAIRDRLAYARARLQTPFLPGGSIELDPLGALEQLQSDLTPRFGPHLLLQQGGYAISRDGRVLVMSVKPARPSSDILFAHHSVRYLEKTVKRVIKAEGPPMRDQIHASFAGSHVDVTRAVQNAQQTLKYYNLMLGLVLVLFLFVLVFRKIEAIVYVSIPVVFGIDWTLGLAGLFFEQISVAAMACVLVVIAIGFEFCLHIYNRFLDELYQNQDYEKALETAFVQTGRGIWTSAVAGSLIFATLLLGRFEGMRELGAVASLGVLCGMLSTFLILPTILAFKARMRKGRVRVVELPTLGLSRIAETIHCFPRATLVMGFLLTVYFAYWALNLEYRETPSPYTEPKALSDDYFKDYPPEIPAPSHPILALIQSSNLDSALEQNDLLFDNLQAIKQKYRIISVDSLRRTLPSVGAQKAFRERMSQLDLDAIAKTLEQVGKEEGFSEEAFTPFLSVLGSAWALPPDDLFLRAEEMSKMPKAFSAAARHYLKTIEAEQLPSGKPLYLIVTAIYPSVASFQDGGLNRFLIEAGHGVQDVRFTGDELLRGDIAPEIRQELARSALMAIAIVFLALSIHFHSVWRAIWAMGPVACITLWVFGAMALLDIHLHFYSLILLPLVLILAIDHNLHFLQRCGEGMEMRAALEGVGRAMLTTSLATMAALGVLSMANHEGLRHIGLLMIFGNALALLGSITLLPALARLRELGHGLAGIIGIDGVGQGYPDS